MGSMIHDKLQRLHKIRMLCGPLGDLLLSEDRNKSLQGDNIIRLPAHWAVSHRMSRRAVRITILSCAISVT